ncbi:terminase large subunit domain-containing protein, partial [Victivallis vadensis]
GTLYIGVDLGREHDLTVIWINEYAGERHLCRRLITLEKVDFTRQEEILYSFLKLPNVRRCCIDASGMGIQFAERAAQRFGKYRVEGVKFSAPVKEELAYPFRAAFEDGNLRIPFDRKLRADLRAVKKETTAAG